MELEKEKLPKKTTKKVDAEKTEQETPAIKVSEKTELSRALLELFVYGHEKDKMKVKALNEELQKQMGKHLRKTKARVRILWYIEPTTPQKGHKSKTDEEIIEWFMQNKKCKYHLFVNDGKTFTISSEFVMNALNSIKDFEKSFEKIKKIGIMISK